MEICLPSASVIMEPCDWQSVNWGKTLINTAKTMRNADNTFIEGLLIQFYRNRMSGQIDKKHMFRVFVIPEFHVNTKPPSFFFIW
jgi:hypothetical protein